MAVIGVYSESILVKNPAGEYRILPEAVKVLLRWIENTHQVILITNPQDKQPFPEYTSVAVAACEDAGIVLYGVNKNPDGQFLGKQYPISAHCFVSPSYFALPGLSGHQKYSSWNEVEKLLESAGFFPS